METTKKQDGDLRITIHSHGDAWTRYIVVPRPAAQRLPAVMEQWVAPWAAEAGYSPTGRAFWNEPRIIRRRNFVVIQQTGGLDV